MQIKKSCLFPVASMSSCLVSLNLAGFPKYQEHNAVILAIILAWLSLPPKPPPKRLTFDVTFAWEIPSTFATQCWTSVGCCVEDQTVNLLSSSGMTSDICPSR